MNKVNIKDINTTINAYDVFICSTSFEDRCLSITSHLNSDQFNKIIVCHFKDNFPEANANLHKLQDILGDKCSVLYLEKDSPLSNYDIIYDELASTHFESALLDISTFTREMFLIIIKLFEQGNFKTKSLTLTYNPSDKYSSFPKDEVSNLWLSKGVKEIRTVLGYSGDLSPIKDNLLIVLVGFEADRSQVIIDSFEAEKLYLGRAPEGESTNENLAQINDINFKMLLRNNPHASSFEFSCKNIDISIQAICNIVRENKDDYNIIISPMCNKLSTLATVAVSHKYPEVQICYASTNLYNTVAYSTPSDYIYIIEANELYNE